MLRDQVTTRAVVTRVAGSVLSTAAGTFRAMTREPTGIVVNVLIVAYLVIASAAGLTFG